MAGTHKSGRKRTPIGIKLVKGSVIRPADRRALRVPPALPDRPASLETDDLAARHWESVARRLGVLGILRTTDGEALGRLCLALADADRLRDEFRRTGYSAILVETITRQDGTVIKRPRANPLLRAVADNSRLVRQWLSEFGMTPATLAKLAPAPTAPMSDPMEDILNA